MKGLGGLRSRFPTKLSFFEIKGFRKAQIINVFKMDILDRFSLMQVLSYMKVSVFLQVFVASSNNQDQKEEQP